MGLGIDRNQPNIIAAHPSQSLHEQVRKTSREIMPIVIIVRL